MKSYQELPAVDKCYLWASGITLVSIIGIGLPYFGLEIASIASAGSFSIPTKASTTFAALAFISLTFYTLMLSFRSSWNIYYVFTDSVYKLSRGGLIFLSLLAIIPTILLIAFSISLLLGVLNYTSILTLSILAISFFVLLSITATLFFVHNLSKLMQCEIDEAVAQQRADQIKWARAKYTLGQFLAILGLIQLGIAFNLMQNHPIASLTLFFTGSFFLITALLLPLGCIWSRKAYTVLFCALHKRALKLCDKIQEKFYSGEDYEHFDSGDFGDKKNKLNPPSLKLSFTFLLVAGVLDVVFSSLATQDVWKFKESLSAFGGMAWFQTFIILAAISLPLVVLTIQNSHRYHKDLSGQWAANKLTKKVNIPAGILYVLTGCLAIFGLMTTFESSRNWLIDGLKDKGFGTLNISQSDGIKMIITAAVFGICIFLFLRNYRYHKVYSSFLNNATNANDYNNDCVADNKNRH